MKKGIVVKIGGSLLYKEDLELNLFFINKLRKWYLEAVKKYQPVVLVTGGGRLSRKVSGLVKDHIRKEQYRHSISMELTQTNAFILKGFINDNDIYCPETLGDAYEYLMSDVSKVMIAGGLRAGWSTDMDAAVFADIIGLKKVYKLSDIESLYTEDPKGNPNAKPIKEITWKKYRGMFGIDNDNHKPDLHIPISAECSIFCENKRIGFFISGGENVYTEKKLDSLFESGTYIRP